MLDKMEKAQRVVKRQISIDNVIESLGESDIKVRKPMFRTREKKTMLPKNQVSVKAKITDNKALNYFYRYQLVSLLTLLNRREDYLNSLRNKAR